MCCALRWGFLQWICKAFLIFKSNLELALSNILKGRDLYESRDVAIDVYKYETCYIFVYVPVLKWRQISPV